VDSVLPPDGSLPQPPHQPGSYGPWRRLVVVGLGLIGGSFALAAKRAGLFSEIWGIDANHQSLAQAMALGVINRGAETLRQLMANLGDASPLGEGDCIYIAVPTRSVPAIIAELQASVDAKVTITDGASVKGSVVAALSDGGQKSVPANFIPGHPIAGSEQSGLTAARADLFAGKRCILCPDSAADSWHLARVTALWQQLGAQVHCMSALLHDQVFAATSHLPHLIAFSLVDTLAQKPYCDAIFHNAAGGFTGFTRIASSDPVMWRDIALANRDAVVACLDEFVANLLSLRTAMQAENAEALEAAFTRAKTARDQFLCAQTPAEGDAPR
jgi:prephenate dehydrogenase